MHAQRFNPREVQKSTLLSIKTGGCPETCTYCSQSSSWKKETGLVAEKLMDLESVFEMAVRAKESGSTRFCMGAAWRGPSQVGLLKDTTKFFSLPPLHPDAFVANVARPRQRRRCGIGIEADFLPFASAGWAQAVRQGLGHGV